MAIELPTPHSPPMAIPNKVRITRKDTKDQAKPLAASNSE